MQKHATSETVWTVEYTVRFTEAGAEMTVINLTVC